MVLFFYLNFQRLHFPDTMDSFCSTPKIILLAHLLMMPQTLLTPEEGFLALKLVSEAVVLIVPVMFSAAVPTALS